MNIFNTKQHSLDMDDAALFLRNALADGPRPMNDIFHEAQIYGLGFGVTCKVAEEIGVIEYWDKTKGRIMWKWDCV